MASGFWGSWARPASESGQLCHGDEGPRTGATAAGGCYSCLRSYGSCLAAANMWIGITQAGSFKEDSPIFLLICLLPVAVAVWVKWKFM